MYGWEEYQESPGELWIVTFWKSSMLIVLFMGQHIEYNKNSVWVRSFFLSGSVSFRGNDFHLWSQYGGRYMVTNNISEIRKEKHLSQDDLAVALGVCRKSIFNIEHNNVIPNIDTCLRLAKYLDMTVEDLFEIQDA